MPDTTLKPAAKHQRKRKSSSDKNATLWVAVISGIVSITLAIIAFPPLVTYINSKWNATQIPQPTFTPFVSASETPSYVSTNTPEHTLTFTASPIAIDTPTATSESTGGTMNAQITYNYSAGNAPLHVTFNAHSSYVSYPDGTKEECKFTNVCTYQWDVREKNGSVIFGPVQDKAEFSYTFGKKGEYVVVVYVCRGNTCNYGAANVKVR